MAELPRPVSVIIPVFNAPDDLARCLESVGATVAPGTEVLVIDDRSTDTEVPGLLSSWAQRAIPGWLFLEQSRNRGFVATANRGMRTTQNDVVLLNSDTVVTPGWLEGLQRCLASDPHIATATPWTNNGEIMSMPRFCEPNPVPRDPAAVARVIAGCGRPDYPDVPTAVGFCMAISRDAIERVGLFDELLFGKGYGEENDFSMKAAKAGLRNVLCDDVYVAHVGGCSFGPTGVRPDESSMARLLSRHPEYEQRVQDFVAGDPLAGRRNDLLDALARAGVSLG